MWVGPLPEKKQPRIRGNGEEMGDLPPTARSLLEWMANVGHLSEKMSMMILWILGLPFFQTGPYGLFHLLGLLNAAH